ncbi:MAG: archaeal flagellar protein FlaJ [Candidatus Methanomethylophilaceae archaeon]|nr:archaeal flagellar protein FlaJ [Candidatus Methanomethylophilaceae archaeon]MDI3541270.1 archaeal flagellar protein FlaJ [Candidatus Methanomethylophilaceae archaeon]
MRTETVQEDILDLSRLRGSVGRDYGMYILAITMGIGIVLIVMAVLRYLGSISISLEWYDIMALAFLVMLGPYGFYATAVNKRKADIESRLPDFLRDVAEAGRFGMTLPEAIRVASHGKYGKLTPEIRRMAAQIEWGVPAPEALQLFVDRVRTPLVERMIAIIIKANNAGGNVSDVLGMVARDAREARLMEEERKVEMITYMIVIYIAFFVFIATIFILNSVFLPAMSDVTADGTMINVGMIPAVQVVFVVSIIVHAVGDGIMAGVLQDGRIANGMRHGFIMLLTGMVSLALLGGV